MAQIYFAASRKPRNVKHVIECRSLNIKLNVQTTLSNRGIFENLTMNKLIEKVSIPLAVVLLMFPQIIETMYSPALTSVKSTFGVSSNEAAQAMSIFFVAFAFGVVFWGRMCDVIGRRVSTILGLSSSLLQPFLPCSHQHLICC